MVTESIVKPEAMKMDPTSDPGDPIDESDFGRSYLFEGLSTLLMLVLVVGTFVGVWAEVLPRTLLAVVPVALVDALALGIFGGGLLFFLRRLADPSSRLVVTGEGIHDRTSLFGGPIFIDWDNVKSLYRDGPYLMVKLHNPSLVDGQVNPMQRLAFRTNRKFKGASLGIVLPGLRAPPEQVSRVLQGSLERARLQPGSQDQRLTADS